MIELKPLILQYMWYVEAATLATAIVITISSIDDVFIDIYYWFMRVRGSIGVNIADVPAAADINEMPERPFAVMVPAWKEHDVIFSMLSSNSRLLRYEQAHYFVGVYLNDGRFADPLEEIRPVDLTSNGRRQRCGRSRGNIGHFADGRPASYMRPYSRYWRTGSRG